MNLRILMRCLVVLAVAGSVAFHSVELRAKTKETKTEEKGDPEKSGESKGAEIQRVPAGAFENLINKVSNLQFYSSNYGILFLNVQAGSAGGIYPRGSGNRYLFGGGVWFGAMKFVKDDPDDVNSPETLKKMSVISYNPNSGASWMVPGEVSQPYQDSRIDQSQEAVSKYRIYFSTDYNSFTGEPFDQVDVQNGGVNWPIWDTDPNETFYVDRYLGNYVSDVTRRNRATFPKGPAIVSGEDIVTIFKDTDLTRYEIGKGRAERDGYPLGIEVDQRIYSWGFGQYQNFIFIRYSIVNKSADTLYDCWMAPALDTDIGDAGNDRTKAAILDRGSDSLNLGVQWSEAEATRYGYMGADFLESPAVDGAGFIRKDKKFYTQEEQLGMATLRNWVIDIDPKTPEERYDFMATKTLDDDNGPGDKRFLMATGPFSMLPGDTARIVVAILIAPSKANTPTGEWEDFDSLRTLDLFAQKVYDENFIAPRPPEQANVDWRPLDNGVELTWDEASERSLDFVERGLDFAGYIIQRTRKSSRPVIQYDSIVGYNLGWKTIGRFDLPPLPTGIERVIAARQNNPSVLGAWWRLPMLMDTVPGAAAVELVARPCFDTVKRQGLSDTIIASTRTCFDTVFRFEFDPFDDEANDSAVFAGTRWTSDPAWGDRFKNKAIRDVVRDAIAEIMDSVTNERTFIDVGDDNQDGNVEANSVDLTTNEKLINNIDYYYQVLAFDQGDVTTGSPLKLNSGIAGKNEVRATPEAPPAGLPVTPEVISQDGLGGVSNFRLIVYDEERLGQLFGGDELEFEFQPFDLFNTERGILFRPSWYTAEVIVRSKKLGELNRFIVPFDLDFSDRADNVFRNVDSSYISRFVYFRTPSGDSTVVDSVYYDARHIMASYNNTFVTQPGTVILGTNGVTKSTFGIAFDYAGQMFGDSLRFGRYEADSTQLPARGIPLDPFQVVDGPAGGSPNTNVVDGTVVHGFSGSQTQSPRNIPSIGQVKLEIEFLEGGTENLEWVKNNKTYRVNNVPYLNAKVRNIATFERNVITEDGASTTVNYDYEFPVDERAKLGVDTASNVTLANEEAVVRLVETGKFAIFAYDWTDINSMTVSDRRSALKRTSKRPSGRPIGTPNRYYVGSHTATIVEDNTQVDVSFTHRLIANGAITLLDFAGMGDVTASINASRADQIIPENRPTQDFQAGDKVIVNFSGGALGLPEPGGKIVVRIPDPTPGEGQFTDDLLDAVRVVPNPYLVDHLGQRSSSEKLLYFTRLPVECTIEIYTVAGELLQTIEHNTALNTDGRVAVNAWDLVTKGGRQAETQLLIARITTPDGAETIKKFSIVVGGFRLFTE